MGDQGGYQRMGPIKVPGLDGLPFFSVGLVHCEGKGSRTHRKVLYLGSLHGGSEWYEPGSDPQEEGVPVPDRF